MSELIRHGMPVENVFDLLGTLENGMTDALGFTLSRSPVFLRTLAADLGYEDEFAPGDSTVAIQNHRKDQGITDLEMRIAKQFIAIIEAKSGSVLPSAEQLGLYAKVLGEHEASHKQLVALTNATHAAAASALEVLSIPGAELTHRSWREVRQLAVEARKAESANRAKSVLEEFIDYLGGIIGMDTKFNNMVYVVSLSAATPDGWSLSWIDVVEKRSRYFYPAGKGWPDPPNYLGFRYNGRLQRIHHVESFELFTNPHDVFPEAAGAEWPPHYCFELGPAIFPGYEVRSGPRVRQAARVWCMLDTLLTSPTISDALTETKRRAEQG